MHIIDTTLSRFMTRLTENRVQAYQWMVSPGTQHPDTWWLKFAIQHMSLSFGIEEQRHCAEIWQDCELSGSLLESHRRCWGHSPKWSSKLPSRIFVWAQWEGKYGGVFVNGGVRVGVPGTVPKSRIVQGQKCLHKPEVSGVWGMVNLIWNTNLPLKLLDTKSRTTATVATTAATATTTAPPPTTSSSNNNKNKNKNNNNNNNNKNKNKNNCNNSNNSNINKEQTSTGDPSFFSVFLWTLWALALFWFPQNFHCRNLNWSSWLFFFGGSTTAPKIQVRIRFPSLWEFLHLNFKGFSCK